MSEHKITAVSVSGGHRIKSALIVDSIADGRKCSPQEATIYALASGYIDEHAAREIILNIWRAKEGSQHDAH